MDDLQWYHIVLLLVGGGAIGAFVSAVVQSYRNRVQPVAWHQELIPIFRKDLAGSALNGKLIVKDDQAESQFDNLFIVDLRVVNRGNRDFQEFPLCVELGGSDRAITVREETADLSHKIHIEEDTKPSHPSPVLHVTLQPFNRRDSYMLKVYVVTENPKDEPQNLRVSSSAPVRLTSTRSMSAMLVEMASSIVLNFGFFSATLSWPRRPR